MEAESFVGSLAENGCVRAVGVDGSSRTGNVSAVGEEMEMEILDSVATIFSLGGEEDRGIVEAMDGNVRWIGEGTVASPGELG